MQRKRIALNNKGTRVAHFFRPCAKKYRIFACDHYASERMKFVCAANIYASGTVQSRPLHRCLDIHIFSILNSGFCIREMNCWVIHLSASKEDVAKIWRGWMVVPNQPMPLLLKAFQSLFDFIVCSLYILTDLFLALHESRFHWALHKMHRFLIEGGLCF